MAAPMMKPTGIAIHGETSCWSISQAMVTTQTPAV